MLRTPFYEPSHTGCLGAGELGCTAMAGLEKRRGIALRAPLKFCRVVVALQDYAFIKSMTRIVAGELPLLAEISIIPTLHVHM